MNNINQERYDFIEGILKQQLDSFREKMVAVSDEVMSNVYTDVLPHIASDTEYNINNRVEYALKNLLSGNFEDISTDELKPFIKVSDGYGMNCYIHMSQYDNVCKNIYEKCKEDIHNNVIEELKSKVERLQEDLKQSYLRY